jgi:hypothetical protein
VLIDLRTFVACVPLDSEGFRGGCGGADSRSVTGRQPSCHAAGDADDFGWCAWLGKVVVASWILALLGRLGVTMRDSLRTVLATGGVSLS